MTGQLERARVLLVATLALPCRRHWPPYASWMLAALADLEERSGDIAAAERSLRRAVVAGSE